MFESITSSRTRLSAWRSVAFCINNWPPRALGSPLRGCGTDHLIAIQRQPKRRRPSLNELDLFLIDAPNPQGTH